MTTKTSSSPLYVCMCVCVFGVPKSGKKIKKKNTSECFQNSQCTKNTATNEIKREIGTLQKGGSATEKKLITIMMTSNAMALCSVPVCVISVFSRVFSHYFGHV